MPKADPTPAEARRARVAAAIQRLPTYYTDRDLLTVLGSRDLLVEAYAQEWLPPEALHQLEEHPGRLHCWLLARLLRKDGLLG